LCYWPIKFRGEYLRWLLAYLKVQHTENNPANSEQWGIIKAKLSSKNPLISLPFLYDHNLEKVTCQSEAISFAICLRYGGKELLGRDGIEIVFQRSLQESVKTIREFAIKCMDYTTAELQANFSDQVSFRVSPKLRYMD
jgi:glutathione S-transferase